MRLGVVGRFLVPVEVEVGVFAADVVVDDHAHRRREPRCRRYVQ
jgi:hypothetical protein